MTTYHNSIFIFTRDLRLTDNTALIHALKESDVVTPIFVLTKEQVGNQNSFRSDNCIQFMAESLISLDSEIRKRAKGSKLYMFYDKHETVVARLVKEKGVDAVYMNMDYTPYARKRQRRISDACKKLGVDFHVFEDLLLHPIDTLKNDKGEPFKKFTTYFSYAKKVKVFEVAKNNATNYYRGSMQKTVSWDFVKKLYHANDNVWVHGGRDNGLKLLAKTVNLKNYNKTRDQPALPTTHMSAYIKFGVISAREMYHYIKKKLGAGNLIIAQLYWRDFYTTLLYYYPFMLGHNYFEKYDKLKWDYNTSHFNKWKTATTGFPIVDAGMRQINATGWMHNRARLIVASFLCKDLHINWMQGEKYFAQNLVDYDPAVNNGNWAWVASTGADNQPFFRIFNPWLQSKKYDRDCEYIKRWVPELKDVPNAHIHNWYKYHDQYDVDYPPPMVDHDKEAAKAIALYKRVA